ncbi:MAG: hypothetical protein NC121_15420 [Blautia sp.]|nr:hypothetical protein [Blautia sp.]
MKYTWKKRIAVFLCEVLVITALIMGISIMKDGMYLLGIPSIDDVQRVTISCPDLTGEVKEFTDREQVELAVKLTGFLRYSLFGSADASGEPMAAVTYYLKNGETVSVAADNKTVWWKGRAHAIKEEETFIDLTKALFFFNEAAGNQ